MTERRPLVRQGGRNRQLPPGDTLPMAWDELKTVAPVSGVVTIDLSSPAGFRVSLTGDTTLAFSNVPTGRVVVFTVTFVQDATGGRLVSYPGNVKADGGGVVAQPATAAGAVTVQSFYTDDGGATIWQARDLSGLGTAAFANTTVASADTTPGRVTRVGDGGLLGTGVSMAALASQSLGDANFTFFYEINPLMTDRPCEYGAGLHIKYGSQKYGFDFAGDVQTGRFFLRTLGATGLGTWREIFHSGNLTPNQLNSYTKTTLPSAGGNPRLQAWCSDLTGGAAPVYSNGTNWYRTADNTLVN